MMRVQAQTKYLPISAQKLRLVADQVRGRDANEASVILAHMPKKGAELARKTLESAIANAEENFELSREDLYIHSMQVNEGPSLKRVKAGARGRYKPRVKRTSHLIVILEEREV
jgi:large subunit ribosomal protein L22